jgi:hypothetical protein
MECALSTGQILWGALFSRLLGFSLAILRLSTMVLAWAGLLASFLIFLLLKLLLQSLLFEALWLFYDRYYLPLLPGVAAFLLARLRPMKVAITVVMVGVRLWWTIAVTGTIAQWRYHLTVVEARDWLLRHAVVAEHLDAGYALTGWWLYAHAPSRPGHLRRHALVRPLAVAARTNWTPGSQ